MGSISFADPLNGWAGTSSIYASPSGAILHTKDGGESWDASIVPMLSYTEGVQYTGDDIRLTGDESRVLHTDDLGATWSWESYAPWWQGIGWKNAQTGWLASVDFGGTMGYALRTDNGGLSWQRDPNAPGGSQVVFVDDLHGWMLMSGNGGPIWRTVDGGDTWVPQTPASRGHHQAGYFLDNQRGWLVDYGGHVHRTTNGGSSWQIIGLVPHYAIYDLFMADELTGWVTAGNSANGGEDGLGFIYKTTNGGVPQPDLER